MSREEAMNALIESGMELRRDDIELGKRLERERIIKIANGLICFNHLDNGQCEHSACYSLELLVESVNGK